MSKKVAVGPIQSTAGAVPVRNEKGQVSMQKVKVHRYVSGKRPDYAPHSSSEDESEDEEFVVPARLKQEDEEEVDAQEEEEEREDYSAVEQLDPRLRRLQQMNEARRVQKPEILSGDESEEEEEEERPGRRRDSDSESGEEDLDDAEIERRRAFLRQRALEKQEDELLTKEEEKESGSEEESESEYEEYTDSEEEARPRLKPVFVSKHDRVTVKEKEVLDQKERELEDNLHQRREERRKETLKIIEEEIQQQKGSKAAAESALLENLRLEDVNTDDENEEAEYEAWKIRELKRIKRDREEREAIEREKQEIERLHGMTEEERRLELKLKPKQVLNKASKGKYKFLQKYYHRGVFYLDKEEDVLKRDYSSPTLEDHFDKTILPKVMQVKNFGRSGRTKYTHLVDQDTTNFESPWVAETSQNLKFYASQAAGVRQVFDKPSTKKRKMDME